MKPKKAKSILRGEDLMRKMVIRTRSLSKKNLDSLRKSQVERQTEVADVPELKTVADSMELMEIKQPPSPSGASHTGFMAEKDCVAQGPGSSSFHASFAGEPNDAHVGSPTPRRIPDDKRFKSEVIPLGQAKEVGKPVRRKGKTLTSTPQTVDRDKEEQSEKQEPVKLRVAKVDSHSSRDGKGGGKEECDVRRIQSESVTKRDVRTRERTESTEKKFKGSKMSQERGSGKKRESKSKSPRRSPNSSALADLDQPDRKSGDRESRKRSGSKSKSPRRSPKRTALEEIETEEMGKGMKHEKKREEKSEEVQGERKDVREPEKEKVKLVSGRPSSKMGKHPTKNLKLSVTRRESGEGKNEGYDSNNEKKKKSGKGAAEKLKKKEEKDRRSSSEVESGGKTTTEESEERSTSLQASREGKLPLGRSAKGRAAAKEDSPRDEKGARTPRKRTMSGSRHSSFTKMPLKHPLNRSDTSPSGTTRSLANSSGNRSLASSASSSPFLPTADSPNRVGTSSLSATPRTTPSVSVIVGSKERDTSSSSSTTPRQNVRLCPPLLSAGVSSNGNTPRSMSESSSSCSSTPLQNARPGFLFGADGSAASADRANQLSAEMGTHFSNFKFTTSSSMFVCECNRYFSLRPCLTFISFIDAIMSAIQDTLEQEKAVPLSLWKSLNDAYAAMKVALV